MKCISCVVTAHNEGVMLKNSLDSVMLNIKETEIQHTELIICLDRSDSETIEVAELFAVGQESVRTHLFDLGDVGLVRQQALKYCNFEHVSFLDGDDIWGSNWLLRSNKLIKDRTDIILHPDLTVFFDDEIKYVRKNPDSTKRSFDKAILLFENLWTSSFITPKQIMLDIPMKSGKTFDDSSPYAYEDWSWFREALIAGYEHRVVKKTVHFQRIKEVSNTTRSLELKKEPWPIDVKKLLF